MSKKWNDVSFNPMMEILVTDGQNQFLAPMPLNHACVSHLASVTSKKCEDKFNEKLLIFKSQMQCWGRSSQGEGGCDDNGEDDDNYLSVEHKLDSLDSHPCCAHQTRA
jgi:hypothetical protein